MRVDARRLLAVLLLVAMAVPPRAFAAEVEFGAVDAFFDGARADELGVRWSRLMFPWQRVQRTGPSEWWPAISEDIIDREVRRGRKLAGVLVNTPDWAATGTGRSLTSPPKNLSLPVTDPNNYWAAFVRRSAAAYRGRVDTWIIWNEPDVWDPDHPGFTWSGTVEEFYLLQKVAYQAAKLGNPSARVVLPGLTYWWDERGNRTPYFSRLLDVAVRDPEARANGWYFDAAVLQLYNDPQLLYDVPRRYRRMMAEHGIDKPIWINETNVAPWDDPERPLTRAHFRADQLEQASYMVQAYAMALAAGVERIAVYKLRDDADWQFGWESYGVVRADGSVRPAFRALQLVHRIFTGVQGGSLTQRDGVSIVTLRRAAERITVLWSRGPRVASVRLRAVGATATIYGRDGASRNLPAERGWYRFDLPASTHNTVEGRPEIFQVGGAPVIVVESGPSIDAQVEVDATTPAAGPIEPIGLLGRAIESLRLAKGILR